MELKAKYSHCGMIFQVSLEYEKLILMGCLKSEHHYHYLYVIDRAVVVSYILRSFWSSQLSAELLFLKRICSQEDLFYLCSRMLFQFCYCYYLIQNMDFQNFFFFANNSNFYSLQEIDLMLVLCVEYFQVSLFQQNNRVLNKAIVSCINYIISIFSLCLDICLAMDVQTWTHKGSCQLTCMPVYLFESTYNSMSLEWNKKKFSVVSTGYAEKLCKRKPLPKRKRKEKKELRLLGSKVCMHAFRAI